MTNNAGLTWCAGYDYQVDMLNCYVHDLFPYAGWNGAAWVFQDGNARHFNCTNTVFFNVTGLVIFRYKLLLLVIRWVCWDKHGRRNF
jgi:L-rhamnose isomerase